MSKENRPNLHAVGLMTDIMQAMRGRVRGKAGEDWVGAELEVLDDIAAFVELLSDKLDEKYGT